VERRIDESDDGFGKDIASMRWDKSSRIPAIEGFWNTSDISGDNGTSSFPSFGYHQAKGLLVRGQNKDIRRLVVRARIWSKPNKMDARPVKAPSRLDFELFTLRAISNDV